MGPFVSNLFHLHEFVTKSCCHRQAPAIFSIENTPKVALISPPADLNMVLPQISPLPWRERIKERGNYAEGVTLSLNPLPSKGEGMCLRST